ncbi:MAG: PEP-CTERM sorting domain-containing protein [Akkermansiaceae bacterium]
MKHSYIIASVAAGLCSLSAQAASYTSNFSGLLPGGAFVGVDGWTQSQANLIDGEVIPWAFGVSGSDNVTRAAVGGYYNTDITTAGSFYTSHTLSISQNMLFSMNFGIIDSEGFQVDVGGPFFGRERNSFQIAFHNGSAEIFALVFDPNPNVGTNPEDSLNDTWNISASSGGVKSTASMAIFESQFTALAVSLTTNGSNLDYMFSLTSGNTANSSGTFAGLGGFTVDEMRIGIAPESGQYGTNFLYFDGIVAAVPEPSSVFLLAAAAGGLAFRRRRI